MVATAQALSSKKSTGSTEDELGRLYEQAFPAVAKFVSRMGGSLEQAKDIFHDALIIYLEGATQNNRTIHTTKEAYICSAFPSTFGSGNTSATAATCR